MDNERKDDRVVTVIDGGYVDAARLAANAFTVHAILGTSRGSGDVIPRIELTMSRDFAQYLADALRAALEAPS